jgi:outer membrane protein OmpA-like peptidoglycan-associated protein
MKNRLWIALLLGATLTVPALAQQSSSTSDQSQPAAHQPAATQDQSQPAAQEPAASNNNQAPAAQPAQSSDQSTAGTSYSQTASNQDQGSTGSHAPLVVNKQQGFWGKLNPFARKKYIQRQMAPVRDRVNELDELTASNAKSIRDVDSRATEGIRLASVKANEADQHAIDAGNRAQAATQTAQQANTRLTTVEQVVTNIDQYKPATQTELRFRSGQTVLSKRAKEALDEMATPLKSQRGYIIEVQGFASGRGQSAIQNSQRMAESVVRYLVLNHEIPVYRIYLLGMGNAPVSASAQGEKPRRTSGGRVEISLLKNSLEQLSSNTGTQAAPANSSQEQQQQQQQQ